MADFRKWFPVLAIAALLLGTAVSASAQPAFTCTSNAGVPPIVRAEGLTELVGDLILNCTGGVPTAIGGAVPQVNVQIFLNTNLTSRILNTTGNWSEALLMIDDPANGFQKLCSGAPCPITANSGNVALDPTTGLSQGINYKTSGVYNVYQGQHVGANSVVWLGVPIDPPGTTATRIVRLTNVRANAFQLGTSSTLIPTQIVMFVSATGTTSVPINNPQQTVAFIQTGLTSLAVRKPNGGGLPSVAWYQALQCVSENKDLSTDSSKTTGNSQFSLRWGEGFATAFKIRNAAGFSSVDTSPPPVVQNAPGAIYNTETGFYVNNNWASGSQAGNGGATAGLADHGTRLIARFNNVPAGVVLYAGLYANTASSDAVPTTPSSAQTLVRLVTTDLNGAGVFSPTAATASTSSTPSGMAIAPITISGGTGVAVWEILRSDPLAVETVITNIYIAYAANTASNLPGLGTATVNMGFAPQSTVGTASASASIPRFADTSTSRNAFIINACSTNLLFPYVTNQAGFDTGLVIANTSLDPFGTVTQAGACKLNYYGETTGGGAAPAAQTSGTVAAGKLLIFTLSTGGNLGIAATPGFQGYMIAQCAFQYAHGFAFISDVGAQKLAEAYLALVMDMGQNRTGTTSETLGQ